MSDKYVLDAVGEPMRCADLMEWARWFETADSARRIAETNVGDVRVSTVFLGLDHSWGSGPPLLFETMIFGGAHDEEQWRYSTRAEAVAGHAAAVKLAGGSAHG
ncbi:MAG: hypothetical protein V4529_16800 [Gemmatimonadota bacterium]